VLIGKSKFLPVWLELGLRRAELGPNKEKTWVSKAWRSVT